MSDLLSISPLAGYQAKASEPQNLLANDLTLASTFYDTGVPVPPTIRRGQLWTHATDGNLYEMLKIGATVPDSSARILHYWYQNAPFPLPGTLTDPTDVDGKVRVRDGQVAIDKTTYQIYVYDATTLAWEEVIAVSSGGVCPLILDCPENTDALILEPDVAATALDPEINSPYERIGGNSWDGAASVRRDLGIRLQVNSAANVDDDWEAHIGLLRDSETFASNPERLRMAILPFGIGFGGGGLGPGTPPLLVATSDPTGAAPGAEHVVFTTSPVDPDGTVGRFQHLADYLGFGFSSAKWRFMRRSDAAASALAAEVVGLYDSETATALNPQVHSPSLILGGSAWDGASAFAQTIAVRQKIDGTSFAAGLTQQYLSVGLAAAGDDFRFWFDPVASLTALLFAGAGRSIGIRSTPAGGSIDMKNVHTTAGASGNVLSWRPRGIGPDDGSYDLVFEVHNDRPATALVPRVQSLAYAGKGRRWTGVSSEVDCFTEWGYVKNETGPVTGKFLKLGTGATYKSVYWTNQARQIFTKDETSAGEDWSIGFDEGADRVLTFENFGAGNFQAVMKAKTTAGLVSVFDARPSDLATGGDPDITSPATAWVAYSWDGAASNPRVFGAYVDVDSIVAANDIWSWHVIAAGAGFAELLYLRSDGLLGLGTLAPEATIHEAQVYSLTGALALGRAAGLVQSPSYTGAFAVTLHDYLELRDVALLAGATLTDAAVWRFDAAWGTHKATRSAQGGASTGWFLLDGNGTLGYVPVFTSPSLAQTGESAEIYVEDGTTAQVLAVANTYELVTAWSADGADGEERGTTTADSATDQITIGLTGLYRVDLTASVSSSSVAGDTFQFELRLNGGATPIGKAKAEQFLIAATSPQAIDFHASVALTAADTVELWATCTTNNTRDFTIIQANMSVILLTPI